MLQSALALAAAFIALGVVTLSQLSTAGLRSGELAGSICMNAALHFSRLSPDGEVRHERVLSPSEGLIGQRIMLCIYSA